MYTESDFPGMVPANSNMAPSQNAPEEPKKKKGLFSFMDKESGESVKKGLKIGAGLLATSVLLAASKGKSRGGDSEYKDLMGSSGCMYGKKDEKGFTISCGLACPLYWHCSRPGGHH